MSQGLITLAISASTRDLISSNLRPFNTFTAFTLANSTASLTIFLLKSIPFNKTVTTHTFRHTHILLLAEKQTPLKTIMARVGHNEPKTTLSIYTHVSDAMKEQEKRILDSIDIMT